MTYYEFITPSDPITFMAHSDKVAFTCALLLGSGKAGCQNLESRESLPTMLAFSSNAEKEISDFIGGEMKDFIELNKRNIAECFRSFAYGSVEDRKTFDDACSAITDSEKLAEFKSNYEDRNRSSMSKWVKAAWDFGDKFYKSTENG